MIYQAIRPSTFLSKLEKHGLQKIVAAKLLDRSPTMISLFASGEKGLSYDLQDDVFALFDFLDETAGASPARVDFNHLETIEPLWRKFKQKRAENEVIRSARELEARENATTSKATVQPE